MIEPLDILDHLGFPDCDQAKQIHGGMDTTIWRVSRGPDTFALRLFREEAGRSAEREYAIIQAAAKAGVNLPRVVAFDTWNGRRAMLMEWCLGETLFQAIQIRPEETGNIGYLLGKAQAALHRIDIEIPALAGEEWVTRLGPVDPELRERLLGREQQPSRLLHLDFHPLNVMVHDGAIGCVLDWNNAALGDPRADVARTWAILNLVPMPPGKDRIDLQPYRSVLAENWLRGYVEIAGTVDDFELFQLWAVSSLTFDLQQHVGKPGSWITQEHIDNIREQVARFRARLGFG
jgi:Ser/Thr protein kinase RdoA (MazF antagonist)